MCIERALQHKERSRVSEMSAVDVGRATTEFAYGNRVVGEFQHADFQNVDNDLLDGARLDERRRIAAEIHDDTIQTIVATGLGLARLGRKYADPEIAEMEVRVRAAVKSLRQLVFELEPDVCGVDLPGSLRGYLERSLDAEVVELHLMSTLEGWPRGAALSVLFRNCREATLNAVRHGRATVVEISIAEVNGMLVTTVLDNGSGCEPSDQLGHGHMGINYMRRRAKAEGGTFILNSVIGEGTAVQFTVRMLTSPVGAPAIHSFGLSTR
jgi:signal transduction histidine kinase